MHVPSWSSWTIDPVVIVVLLAAAVALRARLPAGDAPRGRRAARGSATGSPYGAGLVVLALALMSPLDAIGDGYLLSAHMGQHLLLSDVAPALLVLGLRAPILPLGLPRAACASSRPGGRAGPR